MKYIYQLKKKITVLQVLVVLMRKGESCLNYALISYSYVLRMYPSCEQFIVAQVSLYY